MIKGDENRMGDVFFQGDFLATFVPLFFIFVFGMILFSIFRGVKEWSNNNKQPVLSVEATVTAKRMNVTNHAHENHHHSSTTYYVTFEVESGDRIELHVNGKEYGLISEGDEGKLTFQGTRFLGFERGKKIVRSFT